MITGSHVEDGMCMQLTISRVWIQSQGCLETDAVNNVSDYDAVSFTTNLSSRMWHLLVTFCLL